MWSPFKEIEAVAPEDWKKERWYATDLDRCLGGVYYTRLGKKPTNPPDARSMRIMRMGKQMEKLLVDDIKRHYLKPMPAKKLLGMLFPKLKEVFWKEEMKEKVKKFWNDPELTILQKFEKGLEVFEDGWQQVLFNGYTDPDIEMIETQHYIRDEKLDIGMRLDLLFRMKPGTKPSLIYEIKSMNSKGFWWMKKKTGKFEGKEEHINQAHLYLDYLVKEIPDIQARLLYVSRDDMMTEEVIVEYNKAKAKVAKDKLKLLNSCWQTKTVPPIESSIVYEDGKYKVNWKAKYCSHHALCTGDTKWEQHAENEVAELNIGVVKPTKRIKVIN